MRIPEIARSAEHRTADELLEAAEEGEAAQAEGQAALDGLRARRAAIAGGPEDRHADILDQEIRTRRQHVAEVEAAIGEGLRRYRALTRWNPQPRPGRPGGSP
jgi:hypothetical protein